MNKRALLVQGMQKLVLKMDWTLHTPSLTDLEKEKQHAELKAQYDELLWVIQNR
jgi:hypothetical protein